MVAGESRDRALELVRKMEGSQRFQQTQIEQESSRPGQTPGDNVQFDISALYVPDFSEADRRRRRTDGLKLPISGRRSKIAIAALLVVDIAAVVLLFSPLVGSERSRREQTGPVVAGAAA